MAPRDMLGPFFKFSAHASNTVTLVAPWPVFRKPLGRIGLWNCQAHTEGIEMYLLGLERWFSG